MFRTPAVAALLLLFLLVPEAAAPGPLPVGGIYGSAINMDGLANTQVGGPSSGSPNLMSSYRFRALAGSLESVRVQLANALPGYSGGTGGTIEVTIRPDDGTDAHLPAASVLARAVLEPGVPNRIGTMPLVTFPEPVAITAAELFHVVFRNTDPDPVRNFSSIDSILVLAPPPNAPRQPSRSDLDWAQHLNTGAGWVLRGDYTPIMQLTYANGLTDGIGYVYSLATSVRTIGGPASVRQTFTVRGASRAVSSVAVRLKRVSGSGPLVVMLETAQGTLIEEGEIIARDVPSGSAGWVSLTFATERTLLTGEGYSLVLRAPEGTAYSIFPIEEGSGSGFASTTYFGDGFAEYSLGSGWLRWDGGTRTDLQFMFNG